MQLLRSILREVAGLFVDNGSFAIALAVWTVVAAAVLSHFHVGHWGGSILAAGCIAILIENVLRSSRRR